MVGPEYHDRRHIINNLIDHEPVPGTTPGNIVVIDANGLPTEDSLTSLASILGGLNIQGAWNATTNVPDLTLAGAKVAGHGYIVTVAGNFNLDGITDWKVKDIAWFDGVASVWRKIDNTQDIHTLGGALHSPDTLANFLTKLSDVAKIITNNLGEFITITPKTTPLDGDIILGETTSTWQKFSMTMANLKKDLLDLAGTRAMTGDLDMGTNKVTNTSEVSGTSSYLDLDATILVRVLQNIDMIGGAGFWIRSPQMTTTERNTMSSAWTSTDNGKRIYNTTLKLEQIWKDTGWVNL